MSQTGQVNYLGQQYNLPGVYGIPNTNGLQIAGNGSGQPLVLLVGQAAGGPTGKFHQITGPADLVGTYVGGDIVNAYNFITKYTGATNLAGWALGSNTQSSLTLLDASHNPSIVGTSIGYGVAQNSLGVNISGSAGNLTAQFVNRATNLSVSQSGLGPAFAIAYTGDGTAELNIAASLTAPTATLTAEATGGNIPASVTVNVVIVAKNSACVVPSVETNVAVSAGTTNSVNWSVVAIDGATSYDVYASAGAAAPTYYGTTTAISGTVASIPTTTQVVPAATNGEFLTVALTGQTDSSLPIDVALAGSLSTVAGVVNYVASQVGYTCTASTITSGAIASTLLDSVSAQALTVTPSTVTADKGAVIAYLNSIGQATFVAGTGSTPAATGGIVLFSGAVSTAPQATDWQTFANAIGNIIPHPSEIVLLTATTANIQAVSAGVTGTNNALPSLNLTFYSGCGTNPTSTEVVAISQAASNFVGVCAGSDFYDYDVNGTYTLFPGYMAGAIAAGQAAANPAQPFTNQPLGVVALNTLWDPPTQALLIQNGAMPAAYNTQNVITWVQGTTMDNNPSHQTNLFYVEPSVRDAVFVLMSMMNQTLSAVGGGLGSGYSGTNTQNTIVGEMNNVLAKAASLGLIAGYTPLTPQNMQPYPPNPTWLLVSYTIQVISPINGILATVNVTLPTSSAAVA